MPSPKYLKNLKK
jgi:dihydrofolate synthase/folylpolyglutamate synthase